MAETRQKFFVLESGEIEVADYHPETRRDLYDLDAKVSSATAFLDQADNCEPLRWFLRDWCNEYVDSLKNSDKISGAVSATAQDSAAAKLDQLLKNDEEDGWTLVLEALDKSQIKIVSSRMEKWLGSPPDWIAEQGHTFYPMDGFDLATERFAKEPEAKLLRIEIQDVGSMYSGACECAVLTVPVEEANRIARENNLEYEFVRKVS